MAEPDLYEEIVAAVHDVFGAHDGHRALHSKGSWCEGAFTATPRAGELSRAFHLSGEPIPALVRFSNASGDPQANDADREARGMSVKLRGPDELETDILATTSQTFATRTPEEFLELMRLRRPDPATGAPDMAKLGEFLGAHPETAATVQAVLANEPLASFATARYFSPHAFALVDGDGERTWIRWRFEPDAGEQRLPDDEARARGRDYLHEELASRLATGTVGFRVELQLAAAADPLDHSTAAWPDDRELVDAGRVEITTMLDDPEGDDHIEVFDPNRLVDGVEPSDDPVLLARRHAYSVSAYRRWGRPRGPTPGAEDVGG